MYSRAHVNQEQPRFIALTAEQLQRFMLFAIICVREHIYEYSFRFVPVTFRVRVLLVLRAV